MKSQYNSKGFTLMELIVVIVILALLILMAGPQILKLMESGKQNTFRNEASSIVTVAQTAYTSKSLKPNSGIKTVGGNKYLCMTLEQLKNEGYLEKELNDANGNAVWKGWVEISVPTNSGNATYTLTITNGEYFLQGVKSNEVSDANLNAVSTLTKPANCG